MTSSKYTFNPAADYLFKKLMQNEEVVTSFLESLIGITINELKVRTIEPKTYRLNAKNIAFDYACLLNQKVVVVLEMQTTFQNKELFLDRMVYYHNRSAAQGLMQGDSYRDVKEQYTIVLCTKSPFHTRDYKIELNFMNKKNHILYSKSHLIFFDLNRVYQLYYGKDIVSLKPLQCWLLFFMSAIKKMPKEYIEQLLSKEELKMVQNVIQNSPSDLLDAIVKSLDGMADDDTRYFEELEDELKEKDELINKKDELINKLINDKEKTINDKDRLLNQKENTIHAFSEQNKILLSEILKYNPNFAL